MAELSGLDRVDHLPRRAQHRVPAKAGGHRWPAVDARHRVILFVAAQFQRLFITGSKFLSSPILTRLG
jgi:hypothetical protein